MTKIFIWYCILFHFQSAYSLQIRLLDMIPQNEISVEYTSALHKQSFEKAIGKNIISCSISKQFYLKDTVLHFSISGSNRLPKALLQKPYNKLYDLTLKIKQKFIIENAYFYRNIIFLPVGNLSKKPLLPMPDAQMNTLMDLQGNTCAPSGGILGKGAGPCSNMFVNKNYTKLSIIVFLDP